MLTISYAPSAGFGCFRNLSLLAFRNLFIISRPNRVPITSVLTQVRKNVTTTAVMSKNVTTTAVISLVVATSSEGEGHGYTGERNDI